MYQNILFPTDGSDGSEAALDHAVEHAGTYDATLHVLFVAKDDFGPSGMVEKEHEGVERSEMVGGEEIVRERADASKTGMTNKPPAKGGSVREHGLALVEDVADSVSGVPVETAVLSGDPYKRIREYAEDHDVDLVVMGTHGRTGVDRYLLGSVTEKVVRTADQPVLTVRMREA
ncbi:universal stress protein [Haloarcula salinisoli]|uniref:Universal stress protein n=1 Tax=Haloarcula salinisoli TaxID=2487746 RepID=A0A8J7YB23_9EURY|nr:universal stress protein [Halomicroarcula salinisoli]MBX0285847.1 universal stress protein [Halomicroarcula salinisoli]MBX0302660.1 universal stress protein [Halomicroarcula salinisoli]